MRSLSKLLPLVFLPLAAAGCEASVSSDLDKFTVQEADTADQSSLKYYDFAYNATEMESHIGEYFEIRIVDKDNAVAMKAVYQGVTLPQFSMYMQHSIPKSNPPYRIDYWADHNDSLKYDGIVGGINDKDHAWRRILDTPLPEDVTLAGTVYTLNFVHDTNFVDIATDLQGNKIDFDAEDLLPANITIAGAGVCAGKMMEVRVVDAAAGRLLALHRQGTVPANGTYVARVTDVVDDTSPYQVSVFCDVNANDKYDADEPSWQVNLTSDKTGLVSTLDVSMTPNTPIVTGQP